MLRPNPIILVRPGNLWVKCALGGRTSGSRNRNAKVGGAGRVAAEKTAADHSGVSRAAIASSESVRIHTGAPENAVVLPWEKARVLYLESDDRCQSAPNTEEQERSVGTGLT